MKGNREPRDFLNHKDEEVQSVSRPIQRAQENDIAGDEPRISRYQRRERAGETLDSRKRGTDEDDTESLGDNGHLKQDLDETMTIRITLAYGYETRSRGGCDHLMLLGCALFGCSDRTFHLSSFYSIVKRPPIPST